MNLALSFFVFFCFLSMPLLGKTSAVLDSSATRIEVKSVGKMLISEYRRWKILDEDGYRYCIFNDYQNDFRHLKSFRYTIYDAAGNRVKRFGPMDVTDAMFNASYEVTDLRTLYMDPGYRSFPFVVEIETVVAYDQFLDFPDWMPRYSHNMEVRFASLSLECPAGYRVRSKSYNVSGDSAAFTKGDLKTYVWTVKNLPSAAQYLNYRTFAAEQARVLLSPHVFKMGGVEGGFSTWADFGDWYLALNSDRPVLSEATKQDLQKISRNSVDKKQLVKSVYEYMQRKTRYVSIQLGIGGFKALPIGAVDKNGYGDCKALTHYTGALLAEVGIQSNYVLVRAGRDVPDAIADFPSNQFNHVFLAVPMVADTIWLECTSQVAPASYLGTFTDDRNVLWIESGKSRMIRSPGFDASQSVRETRSIIHLDAEGNAAIEIDRLQRGVYFDELLAYSAMNSDKQESFNLSKFPFPDFSIESFEYKAQPVDQSLSLKYRLLVNAVAARAPGRLLLPLHAFGGVEKEIDVDLANERAEVRHGFTVHDVTEVVFPAGFRPGVLVDKKYASTIYGTSEVSIVESSDEKFVIDRKATIRKGFYRGEDFRKFYDFLKTIRGFDQTRVSIASKT